MLCSWRGITSYCRHIMCSFPSVSSFFACLPKSISGGTKSPRGALTAQAEFLQAGSCLAGCRRHKKGDDTKRSTEEHDLLSFSFLHITHCRRHTASTAAASPTFHRKDDKRILHPQTSSGDHRDRRRWQRRASHRRHHATCVGPTGPAKSEDYRHHNLINSTIV